MLSVDREIVLGETAEHDGVDGVVTSESGSNSGYGERRRTFDGIAVHPGADGWKRDGVQSVRDYKLDRATIAGHQQLRLAVHSAAPDWSDRMDDVPCLQPVAARHLRVTRGASAQPTAFLLQLRPCGAMYRAIHSTAPEQRRVRGVDDRVNVEGGDVRLYGRELRHQLPSYPAT